MKPFEPDIWPVAQREAAAALWAFYRALDAPRPGVPVAAEVQQCEAGEVLEIIPPAVATRAYEVCRLHRLDRALLAEQVRAAAYLVPPVRFTTAAELLTFVRLRCGAHAQLLAHLAGQRGRFRTQGTQEFAKALFLTNRLCYLVQDLAEDRLFLPLSELAQFEVSEAQLMEGRMEEGARRLLWKQAVRIRDAYGACQRLGHDLNGWPRRQFRRHWMEGLYLLSVVEKRKFDVWTKPAALSGTQRLQMRWQILVGKTSFR